MLRDVTYCDFTSNSNKTKLKRSGFLQHYVLLYQNKRHTHKQKTDLTSIQFNTAIEQF